MAENTPSLEDFDLPNQTSSAPVAAKAPRGARTTREQGKRPEAWRPPEMLPMPDERDGFTHRWVRTAMNGIDDPSNVSARLREGWEPCKIADYPELKVHAAVGGSGNVEVGGLLLCRIPAEFMTQRAEYYGTQNKQAMVSVDNNFMRESDPRMPLFKERESKITFGNGT
jgi:hypothetical protein